MKFHQEKKEGQECHKGLLNLFLPPSGGDLPRILTDDETFGRMFFSSSLDPLLCVLPWRLVTIQIRTTDHKNVFLGGIPSPYSCLVCVFGMPD